MFKGSFVNGLKQGKGVYEYADGSKYIGNFKNDLKTGIGE